MNSGRIAWLYATCILTTAASVQSMGISASFNAHRASSNGALSAIAAGKTPTLATAAATNPIPTTPGASSAALTGVTLRVSPKLAAVTVTTQTQQFTSSAKTAAWSVDGVVGGNATIGTISTSGLYTPPSTAGIHTVTATSGTSAGSASIAVTDLSAVFTYHNDTARDGTNAKEYALTSSTVTTATFGKLFSCAVDGAVYTQPLWLHGLSIAGGIHNVIFVATQHDSAYAFDADATPCVTYWHVNLLDTLHGGTGNENPVTWNDVGECFGDIYPEIGVTGTPVIDPVTKTIYLVSASEKDPVDSGRCSGSSATFYHRLHALSLTTGSEKFNAPVTIAASVPGTGDGSEGGMVSFNSQLHHQRSGLVEDGKNIFVVFAAHEDATPYHGWVIGYQASDVQQQTAVFNTTPNGVNGADGGVWAGGGAPAVDSGGDVYVATGNGVFDEVPPRPNNDYGDSILRLHSIKGSTLNGVNLSVAGWFTPYDEQTLQQTDGDLGSGATILFPNQTSGNGPDHLLVQTGKEGVVYLIDRDNMGEFNSTSNDQIRQSFTGPSFGLWGSPALWQNNLYTGGQYDSLRQFAFDSSTELFTTTVASLSAHSFGYPGTSPSVSSRGNTHGIVWTIDASLYGYASPNAGVNCSTVPVPAACTGPAVLHAYDAANLAVEYWNSSMAANGRDQAGDAVKFAPPTVANGKVYVSTRTEIDVYGLLPN
jgi:hypothetical protein